MGYARQTEIERRRANDQGRCAAQDTVESAREPTRHRLDHCTRPQCVGTSLRAAATEDACKDVDGEPNYYYAKEP
jgi:hypothetical protein